MKPAIDGTQFGSITVDGETFEHDIVIRLNGKVKKRKKKLSKRQYGTSHKVSLAEAEHIFDEGAEWLIVGTGQHNSVELTEEARGFFAERDCSVDLLPTPRAIEVWNGAEGRVIAMFHVTC